MVLDGAKPLKSIVKQTHSLIFGHSQNDAKTMPKGISKVMFLIQNGDLGLLGSTYPRIFDVLG